MANKEAKSFWCAVRNLGKPSDPVKVLPASDLFRIKDSKCFQFKPKSCNVDKHEEFGVIDGLNLVKHVVVHMSVNPDDLQNVISKGRTAAPVRLSISPTVIPLKDLNFPEEMKNQRTAGKKRKADQRGALMSDDNEILKYFRKQKSSQAHEVPETTSVKKRAVDVTESEYVESVAQLTAGNEVQSEPTACNNGYKKKSKKNKKVKKPKRRRFDNSPSEVRVLSPEIRESDVKENEDEIEGEQDDSIGRLDKNFQFKENDSGTDEENEVEKKNDPIKNGDIGSRLDVNLQSNESDSDTDEESEVEEKKVPKKKEDIKGTLHKNFQSKENVRGTDGENEVEKNNDYKKKEDTFLRQMFGISGSEKNFQSEVNVSGIGENEVGKKNDHKKQEDISGRLDKNFQSEENVTGIGIGDNEVEKKNDPQKKENISDIGISSKIDSSKDEKAEECASCKLLQVDLDIANARLKDAYDKVKQQAAEIANFNKRDKEGESLLEKMKSIISSKDESSGKTAKRSKKSKLNELPSNLYDDEYVDPSEVKVDAKFRVPKEALEQVEQKHSYFTARVEGLVLAFYGERAYKYSVKESSRHNISNNQIASMEKILSHMRWSYSTSFDVNKIRTRIIKYTSQLRTDRQRQKIGKKTSTLDKHCQRRKEGKKDNEKSSRKLESSDSDGEGVDQRRTKQTSTSSSKKTR